MLNIFFLSLPKSQFLSFYLFPEYSRSHLVITLFSLSWGWIFICCTFGSPQKKCFLVGEGWDYSYMTIWRVLGEGGVFWNIMTDDTGGEEGLQITEKVWHNIWTVPYYLSTDIQWIWLAWRKFTNFSYTGIFTNKW